VGGGGKRRAVWLRTHRRSHAAHKRTALPTHLSHKTTMWQVQSVKEGGILSRLRNAGRKASAAASSLWRSSAGSCSGRSVISSMFQRKRNMGNSTIKIISGSTSRNGPVGEAVEGENAVAAKQSGQRGAAAAAAGGQLSSAFNNAEHTAPHQDQVAELRGGAQQAEEARAVLRRRRTLSLLRSASQRTQQLKPQTAANLSSLVLGADPPPFIFPEALEECGLLGSALEASPLEAAAAAAALPPAAAALPPATPHQQLVDLIVTEQKQREEQQQQQQRAHKSWLPWRKQQQVVAGADGGSTGGTAVRRQGSGSRRYPPAATPVNSTAAQQAGGEPVHVGTDKQLPEDDSYSWHEFYQTLQLIGIDPAGRLRQHGDAARSRAVAAAEGTEPGAPKAPGISFSAGLASLIAEAEEATGDRRDGQQRQPHLPPTAAQPRSRTPPAPLQDSRLDDAVELSMGALGVPTGRDPITPNIQWQRLREEGVDSRDSSTAGGVPGRQTASSVSGGGQSAVHKSPRPGHVSFVAAAAKQADCESSPAFLEAALATLGETSGSGSGAGAGKSVTSGGGVRFADTVVMETGAGSKSNLGVLTG